MIVITSRFRSFLLDCHLDNGTNLLMTIISSRFEMNFCTKLLNEYFNTHDNHFSISSLVVLLGAEEVCTSCACAFACVVHIT